MTFRVRPFAVRDTEPVVRLWHECGLTRPWNDPHRDIERKLAVQPDLFLVAVDAADDTEIVGTVMAGYDGHRGWLHYLASTPARRGEGIGRELVQTAESKLLAMGCPKVQLMVRPENTAVHDFYGALGYDEVEVWLAGRRLIADD